MSGYFTLMKKLTQKPRAYLNSDVLEEKLYNEISLAKLGSITNVSVIG